MAIVAPMSSQIACSSAAPLPARPRPALSLVPPPAPLARPARRRPAPCRILAAAALGAASGFLLAGIAELPLGAGGGLFRAGGLMLAVAAVALARSRALVRRAERRAGPAPAGR